MLAIAARIEEQNPLLQQMLLHLEKVESVKTFELPRLRTTDIDQLVESYVHASVPPAFTERPAADSGGNPLYLGEILRSISFNQVDIHTLENLPISPNLSRLICNRLDRLTSAAQEILQAAAVLGNEIRLPTLSAACQVSPQTLADGLDELGSRHLIRYEKDSDHVSVQFVHTKFREIQLQLISPARLVWLYEEAARALHENADGKLNQQGAVIARHYEQAGKPQSIRVLDARWRAQPVSL